MAKIQKKTLLVLFVSAISKQNLLKIKIKELKEKKEKLKVRKDMLNLLFRFLSKRVN